MQHNGTKLEISNRKRLRKPPNIWKLNKIQINAQGPEGEGRSKGTWHHLGKGNGDQSKLRKVMING